MCGTCGDLSHGGQRSYHPADDLDDGLTDIFGEGLSGESANVAFAQKALSRPVHIGTAPEAELHYDPCKACKGSGRFYSYTGRLVGNCFKCKGTGKIGFKTSAEARQKAADAKAARKEADIKAWMDEHPEETKWLIAGVARGNSFATSMMTDLAKWGSLTANKVSGIQKGIVRDQLREAEKAEIEAMAPTIVGAPLEKIEQAFANAIDYGIQYPKMRLDTFVFSPVRSGKNAGAIYVKHSEELDHNGDKRYLGKIVDGRFVRAHTCTPDEEKRIVAAAMDPEAAAKAYGQRTGKCSICGRGLTVNESIDRAMGPICASRMGW